MSIRFECECGRRLKAGDDTAGRAIRCPACGATIKIPQPAFAAAVLPAEEPASDNSHHLDEEDAPADDISEISPAPGIADDADAQVGARLPRVLPTAPHFGELVRRFVVSQPSGAGSGSRSAAGGETAMQGNIIIGLLLIGLGAPLFGVLKPTPQWEYKVEDVYEQYGF